MVSYGVRALALLTILLAAHSGETRRHQEMGEFDLKHYRGRRAQGVAVIYYTLRYRDWPKQPWKCYGAFVDFTKVVTACSCVAYTLDDAHTSNPWYHHEAGYTLLKVRFDHIVVGVMTDEYLLYANKKQVNTVKVTKVELARDCTNQFRSNMALITLESTPRGAKLVWVYTAEMMVMKWAVRKVITASAAGRGRCEVLRWQRHGKPIKQDYKDARLETARARYHEDVIRIDEDGEQRVLHGHALYITGWNECLEQVCPEYAPAHIKEKYTDQEECFNHYNVSRYCVGWEQMDSLCYVPEGTPVFCDVGELRGFFGILTNHTIWCDPHFNYLNIMIGLDTMMDGLYKILRIRNGPGYDDGWPEYLDMLRTRDDYSLQ